MSDLTTQVQSQITGLQQVPATAASQAAITSLQQWYNVLVAGNGTLSDADRALLEAQMDTNEKSLLAGQAGNFVTGIVMVGIGLVLAVIGIVMYAKKKKS